MIEFPFNPVAFQIGPFSLRYYGLFLALSVVWLIGWMWWQVRKKGAKLSLDTVLTLALVGIPSGVIFARLIHVVDNIVVAKTHPELVLSGAVIDYSQDWASVIGGSGLTAWGAVLGASLGIWTYCKFSKIKIGYVFDLLAPGVIMAQAIGRFGCLFNGCCYGVETSVPWGLVYTHPDTLAPLGITTHATVAYEIFFNLAVFGILMKLRGKLQPTGSLFVLYLAFYAAWRVGIDFLRSGTPFFLGLHQAQFIGMVILLIAVPWMAIKTRWTKSEETASLIENINSGPTTPSA